ncbi:MAG: hypothetical protein H6719_09645 [Sandaracinaceae bacterium]|nr:hypothetical protein [Sandaracinaceae bacterium]
MTTQQRATLAVPSPSPETSMNLGKAWSSTSWNSDGFCVNTDGRVWIDADGTGTSTSTLALLSNADSGQLLLQSLQKNLWVWSKDDTVVGTNGSLFLGGAKSVKILGGLGLSETVGFLTNDFVDGDKADYVGPDTSNPSNDSAQAYVDSLDPVGNFWAITDVASSVLAIGLEIARALLGVKGTGTSASTVATVTGIRYTTSAIGNLVNTSQLYSDGVPGIHLYSWGSICVATPTFNSMFALAGMTEFGVTVNDYGFLDAHAMAGVAATFKGLCYAAIEGSEVSIAAGKDVNACARAGQWKLYATNAYIGAKGGEALTQIPTLSVKMAALTKIKLEEPLAIEYDSGGNVEVKSGRIDIDGKVQLQIKNPAYTVTLTPKGLKIDLAKLATVDLGPTGAVMKAGTSMTMEAAADSATIGLPSCSLACDATGAWSWTAAQVLFL